MCVFELRACNVIFVFTDEQNDSNLLSSDHEVISDVLQEELGPKRSGRISSDGSTIGEPELSSVQFLHRS